MDLLPNLITEPAGGIGAAAQNAREVARFGGLQTAEEPAPFGVFADRKIFRWRRYFPPGGGPLARPSWFWNENRGGYQALTRAARSRLLGEA